MAAATIPPRARISTRRFVFRVVVAILLLLLLVFIGFDVWFYRAVRAALPQRDGTIHLAGLTGSVKVTYDVLGVPHIAASNLPDLLFAQGYITAQDRLWQMDMTRRYAAGDLSEVLGPKYVKIDRAQRILGLRQVAQRDVANMPAGQRAQFEAYAAGVNAYIAQHSKTLPLEFRFLTYFPHVWTAEDSALVGLSITAYLSDYIYKHKLFREKVMARLGPELSADLYVNSSWRDHPPGAEGPSLEKEIPSQVTPDEEENPPPGSNNWVVSGAHTASGKPLLSNDMHLELEIPNVWYEAQLTAGDFDVAGVTLPGTPFVIAGHNRYIGWGFTNLGANVEDIYIEKFNDQGEYLTPQGWVQPEHRKEIIEVKGKPEVTVDVVATRHGPMITDIIPGEKRPLALKWVIYGPQVTSTVFFDVDSAKNWQEFRAAFSRFGTPAQNVVYADVEGHIGYQATGAIPIRASGDGSVPVPGNDDAHEWTGYVPFDQLPSVYDPPSGVIATANGRITPDGYPYLLSIEWMAPYRTERIYKLLNAKKQFTPPDMLAIQTDILSEFDRYCAQRFVYAVDHTPGASPRAKQAADLMRNWDGRMTTDSAAPTIAYYSRKKLQELLLKPKLGDDWKDYQWFMSTVWLENLLAHQPGRWLPPGYANYDTLLSAAVRAAVEDTATPRSLGLWKWGRVHRVEVEHPFWGHFPILKRGAGPGSQPLSGDDQTVKQVSTHFGPSERLTVDFSDLDRSTLNIVSGESGNIFDEHYNDQWSTYYNGTTFPLPFSAAAVQQAGVHHLRLEP